MNNLWDLKDIDRKASNSPNSILEEQAKYLKKNVNDILYAKITNIRLKDFIESDYKLATNFSIVSPTLDNYIYVLFTVYSNPESNYPVVIFLNGNKDYIDIDHICNNEEEFIDKLSNILGSEEVTDFSTLLKK